MPKSPSRPPTDAAGEEFDPVAHALANTNPLSYSFVRAFFNYIARKVSTLSKSKISRLTDDELARVIKDEYSRLTEAEKVRLMDAEFDRLKAIANSIFRLFTGNSLESFFTGFFTSKEEEITPITPPLDSRATSKKEEITPPLYSGSTHDDMIDPLGIILTCIAVLIWLMMMVGEHYKARSYSYERGVIFPTKAAQERMRPLKRSIFLSKYSRTPDLKGLKSIGEFYTGF
ncbi:uncharacterized protein LOC131650835 [Vicia villosa]|uniref:uncharacterized protein LOC131650835 n=1 Tax=Vicia villosa TaxID=3911 RepID=UPI00273B9A75|nr:uncharacterized protein LOC131650835 [Vicia villosa]XP_058776530.1 uncharacterized protein LOC131650835 [Vicia villosa]